MGGVSPLRIAYLGPPASFSHQAARDAFIQSLQVLEPLPSFGDILAAIQCDHSYDYGLLPVENSTNSGVVQVLDLLIQCGLQTPSRYPDVEIVGEHYLEVHHCLFVSSATYTAAKERITAAGDLSIQDLDISVLYTHPQVWGQCNNFLSKHFPLSKVERIDMTSTSAAAVYVSQQDHGGLDSNSTASTATGAPGSHQSSQTGLTQSQPGAIAAISSSMAGEQNKLHLVKMNIEDAPGENTTRFMIIRNRNRPRPSPLPPALSPPGVSNGTNTNHPTFYKSLITFTVPHSTPGSLAVALAKFAEHDFNLTAITTRPSRERSWHYVFFVECEEERQDPDHESTKLAGLVRDLALSTDKMCLVGSWVDRSRHPA